ncbi:MAG: hypothetical protein WEC34_15180 [Acidimicrobiia bacterium]
MEPGTRVEVRTRFDQHWTRGFEVADVRSVEGEGEGGGGARYLIRRRSDDSVLPSEFASDEIRSEKMGRSMWWV